MRRRRPEMSHHAMTFVPILLMAMSDVLPAAACGWGSKAAEIEKLAPLMDLKAGSLVAEIGAGNGAVSVAAGQKVGPAGHVYATEIDQRQLAKIRKSVAKSGLANVTVVEAKEDDTGLPAGCCDAIFMIGVYHHITRPAPTDASIFRALRPGGRLVIVDFRPTLWLWLFTPKGIPANRGGHGIPEDVLEGELSQAGFQPLETFDHWGDSWFLSNYCVVYRKPLE
jgi:ubiquinone/menaquinone biosynthesis C-methylase UbiE